MSVLNLQLNSIAYKDTKPSNNPSLRIFDLGFKLLGQCVDRPKSEDFSIAPGETRVIFNGTRTTAIDGTTEFTVSQPDPVTPNLYRFSRSAGTAPVFRTDRAPAVDNTTVLSVSVNGPLMTLTNSSGTPMDTTNVVVGDLLKLESGSGFNNANIGRFTILAKTVNSITVENLNATAETATVLDFTKFLVYSNGGSNNQIQINDKVAISAGFSPATWGTYSIVEVTPMYFEILASFPNGLPIETGIIPGAAGLVFYSSAKKFVLIAAQQKCSVRHNADTSDNAVIEPIEVNNPEKPGIYIKQGTSYALSIKNLGLETLNLIVATAE